MTESQQKSLDDAARRVQSYRQDLARGGNFFMTFFWSVTILSAACTMVRGRLRRVGSQSAVSTVLAAFTEHWVRPGIVPVEYLRYLVNENDNAVCWQALVSRKDAVERENLELRLNRAEAFIEMARDVLSRTDNSAGGTEENCSPLSPHKPQNTSL